MVKCMAWVKKDGKKKEVFTSYYQADGVHTIKDFKKKFLKTLEKNFALGKYDGIDVVKYISHRF